MTTFEELLKDSVSHAYDIERELGGGGMSRVFVAVDKSLGRKIVIKLLSPELTAGVNRERFRREIQVAAQLQHPHIVPLLSAGEQGEIVYYTMPFIEGESLKTALEKGPLPVRDVIRILYDVVDALGYAHARFVVHRDIKPANILRSHSHSLVTDFGVAKALNAAMPSQAMTSTGLAIGTPAYMAPEQLAGDPTADHRIDIYAVGLMAYELLSGTSPFAALSPQAVMAALFTVDPKPLHLIRKDVPKRLSAIIMQCLSKNAADRPESAEALLSGLDSIATSSGEIRTREHKVPVVAVPTNVVGSPAFLTPPSVAAQPQPRVPTAPVAAPFKLSEPRVPIATPRTVASYTDEEPRSRRGLLLAGIAVLLLAGIAGIIYSQRGGSKSSAQTTQTSTSTVAGQTPVPSDSIATGTTKAAVAPHVLTGVDSLAIAEAIRKRLAQATAAKAPGQAAVNTDSLRKLVQKQMTDSIARAAAATTAAAAAAAAAAAPAAAPAASAPSAKPRLAIAELRTTGDQSALSGFSKALVDALRGSINDKAGFAMVDQDSVHGAIGRTQSSDEVVKMLEPEVMITPSFSGTGDTVRISISVRDLRRGSPYGIRSVSMKTYPAYPQYYVGPLVKAVLKQLDDLPTLKGR